MTAQANTTKMNAIINIYLQFPPSFAPRYDGFRMDKYLRVNTKKEEIINLLLENWKTPNYLNEKLIESLIDIKEAITDSKILDDLREVLIDSVLSAFYENNKETPDLEIEDAKALQTLKPLIISNLENTIFRRTANYSTPYGFI
uniref:Uncharacterized protein n=1 Tax=viral metagenome TaxID=1070528 RepID=A0A6C0IJ70_9ZZZZ